MVPTPPTHTTLQWCRVVKRSPGVVAGEKMFLSMPHSTCADTDVGEGGTAAWGLAWGTGQQT